MLGFARSADRSLAGNWQTRCRLGVFALVMTSALAHIGTAAAQDEEPTSQGRALVGIDVEGFLGAALDSSNSAIHGIGGGAAIGLELNLHPLLGVHVGAIALGLSSSGDFGASTSYFGGRGGLRFHWGELIDFQTTDGWLDVNFDLGSSAGIVSPGFDVGAGVAFRVLEGLRIGPFIRTQYAQGPDDQGVWLLSGGLTIAFLGDPRHDIVSGEGASDDTDGDGVLNSDDLCPTVPAGGQPDPRRAGCPAVDADSDGVLDMDDLCPMEPAGARPDPSHAGCPIRDQDGDDVSDSEDNCPTVPAGASPNPDRPGCPAGDRDGDGVLDHADACPDVAAGAHPDPARAGCPLPDRDGDSVPDAQDACPDEAGAPTLDPEHNGCPGLVRIQGGQIQILRPIFFTTDSDVILERSFPVLQAVIEAMQAGGIRRIRIEGHTDSEGRASYNLELSRRRAVSVARYLSEHSIAGSRLETVGYGQTRPIEDNGTEAGRAANRRVEFHILDATFAEPGQ